MAVMILDNYRIFTGRNSKDFFEGHVEIENGIISKVTPGKMDIRNLPEDCTYIDGKGSVMMPGLINCHSHVYSALARGMKLPFFNPATFEQLLEQLWWKVDRALNEEAVYACALVSAVEMAKNGVTTFIDHHSSPNFVLGSLEKLSEAMIGLCGLKGIFCYETSDRDGKNICRQSIEENLSFHEYAKNKKGVIGSLFGMHASFTIEDETLRAVSNSGLPVHIHVGEAIEDGKLHRERFHASSIERLDKFSVLKPGSLLSHCINIENEDLEIISKRKCHVVFNPQSNMNNGVGLPNFGKFAINGIRILLGNDGYGYDLTKDMRVLPLTQRLMEHNTTSFGMDDFFEVVFKNPSEYVSSILGSKTGIIEEGYQADMITYDYREPTPMSPDNFLSHYYFGIIDDCKPADVISRGRFLKKDMEMLLPEKDIFNFSKMVSSTLWNKM